MTTTRAPRTYHGWSVTHEPPWWHAERPGWVPMGAGTWRQMARMIRKRARAEAAGLAQFTVSRDGQLCSGGREPIERGTRAYVDADGWVWCPEHIPEPGHANR